LPTFQRTSALLEQHQSRLIDIHNYLTHPDLALDAALKQPHASLVNGMKSGEALLDDIDKFLRDYQQFHADYVAIYCAAHAAAHDPQKFLPYARYRETPDYRAVAQMARVMARACPEFVEMERWLERELSKWCQRADLTSTLVLSPTCPACRLKYGESIRLKPLEELAPLGVECRLQFLVWLNDASVARKIQQDASEHSPLRALLRAPLDASTEVILELLTDAAASELNALLAPTRRVARRLSDLRERLAGKRLTKAQAMQAYQQWLDGGEQLREQDEVQIERD
jgi:hypothetical protein